jgi:hypothetical protein
MIKIISEGSESWKYVIPKWFGIVVAILLTIYVGVMLNVKILIDFAGGLTNGHLD